MIHFTCDICGKEMRGSDKDRFVLVMEIRPGESSFELTEEDIDQDNLAKVSDILQAAEATGEDPYEELSPIKTRHDVCSACKEKLLRNPFNCKPVAKVTFSDN